MYARLTDALFDPYFYAQQSKAPGNAKTLRKHFDRIGRRMGFSPGPLFDAAWYLESNKDILSCGLCPYDHFVKWGCKEGRSPTPIFDAEWYRKHQMKPRTNANPFLHFLESGRSEKVQPGPFFWPRWYQETQVGQDVDDPYVHYLSSGWAQGYLPNPLFDLDFYRSKYPQCVGEPISHLVVELMNNPLVSTHPLFDGAYFQRGLQFMGTTPAQQPLKLYLCAENDSQLPNPHPLFDNGYYRQGRGTQCGSHALIDYIEGGATQRVDPHPLFSKAYYYENAPDVLSQDVDALLHFVSSGENEGRQAHPLFDHQHYREQVGSDARSLQDYVLNGMTNKKTIRRTEVPDHRVNPPIAHRKITAIPETGLMPGIAHRLPPKIGIFAHIFHLNCAVEMIDHINHAPARQTRVFVSTDSPDKAARIEAMFSENCDHPFEIRVCPNRGRDIAPFIVGFADRLAEVDLACHIHSKCSLHVEGGLDEWRRYLLRATLGARDTVANIVNILGQDGVGVVVPDHFSDIADLIQWGGNFKTAAALMGMMGQGLERDGALDLPAGSMFWFRTAALQPLLDLRLDYLHFDPEMGQVDGTLAHAIERLFLPVVESAGYSYVTSKVHEGAASSLDVQPQATLGNRLRPMANDLGPTAVYYPHTAGYLGLQSDVERPRINLLIPTADRGKAYAGVSAALEIFETTRVKLGAGFDARIISTDVPINPGTPTLEGYEPAQLESPDVGGINVVTDGTRRIAQPISLRQNDVFVSTAWWTAHQAHQLMKSLSRLFSSSPSKSVYLIQDFENGFEPWSTAWSLADATYRKATTTIPVFNTSTLAEFFYKNGYYDGGHILNPGINRKFMSAIQAGASKEPIVLLYARPHAKRNCLEFLDMVARQAISFRPEFWRNWRFVAIGEDFGQGTLAPNSPIEVLGRLSLTEYAELASRSALAISLMVSPHPSYPPLEMAAAGVKVLTNRYQDRDSSEYHENISSFSNFDPTHVAELLGKMATNWNDDPLAAWDKKAKIDWFFGGQSNIDEVAANLSRDIRGLCHLKEEINHWKRAG